MKPKFNHIQARLQRFTTTSAIMLCMTGASMAATDNLWTGTTSGDWNTAANWSLGAVPTKTADQNAVINTTSPNFPSITLGIIAPVDITIGGAVGNGRLDHASGDASTGSTNSMYVGTAGGTGVYNLANTSGTGGTHTGFAIGSGSMTVNGGTLWVGGSGAGSNGTLNVNTTGTLAGGVAMNISGTGGTGVMNLDNGSVTVNGPIRVGYQTGGNGTLRMSGGSITKTGADVLVVGGNGSVGLANVSAGTISVNGETWIGNGALAGTSGTLNLTGGTLTASSWFTVGRGGATGVLNLNGGTINKQTANHVMVGARDGGASNGTVNHNSGALNMTNGAQLWIGQNANTTGTPKATGTYNLSGGTITLNSWVAIGREGGNGSLNMTGGSITKTGADSNFIIGTSGTGNTGAMTMSGGSVTVAASATADRGITWVGESTAGTFTMSGTADFQTARLTLGVNAAATGTVNFNGGILRVGQITGGAGTANFTFNGGQIIATAASTAFVNNLDTATLGAGGLKLNTNTFNLASAQVFTGSGGLEKSGPGILTLTGANSYAGATSVSEGKLSITTASNATGAISLADATTFGLTQSAVDDSYTTAGVTFGAADATNFELDLGNFAGSTANAPLVVTGSGALALNGAVTVNIIDSLPAVGSVPLVSYTGGKSGPGSFALGVLPDGVVATLDDNGTDLVSLNVTRVNDAYWTGAISTSWDTTTANWNDDYAETSSTYADGDPVMFDDRVIDVGPEVSVMLLNTVAPGGSGVTFANAAKNYTLWGSGKITGTTKLTKQGVGTTTIESTNDYTGVTSVNSGILRVGTLTNGGVASPLGAADSGSSNLVLAGGILSYTGPATTIDRGFTVSGANSGIETTNDLTITGDVFGTAGAFVKTGAGKLTLSGLSLTLGGTGQSRVNGGTLKLDGTGGQTAYVPGDLWVSATPGVPANLEVDSGLLSVAGWIALGRGNGDGVIANLTATNSIITSANFSSGFDNALANNDSDQFLSLSNSTWTNSGQMIVAESNNSTSTVTLTNNSIVNLNNTLLLGRNGANSSGSLVLEGTSSFTKSATGYISLGVAGMGTLTVKGSASFVSNGGDFNVSDVTNSKGTLNIQDSANITSIGLMFIGKGAGTIGTMNISGGTLNANTITIADNATSTATITQTGGTVNMGNNDRIWFGNNGSATWNQSNGTVNGTGWFAIGRNAGSNATWNVSGGTVNQVSPGNTLILAESGNATLTISGTGVVDSKGYQIEMATRAGSTGTLNLNAGGTLRALQIQDVSAGISAINLDGGTLVANTGANALFIDGIDTTTVKSGGVTIDSNGQNIGINVPLLDGTGGGGLTKTGAGKLALNGANTYTGATTVNAGTLGGTGSVAGPLLVSASATLAPGASAGTFTAGATTIAGTYACEIDGSNCDKLVSNGTLNISAATLAITQITPASGSPLVIASYTGSTPAPFASVSGIPSGYTLDYSYGGNSIALIQTSTPYSTWINGFASIPVVDRDPADDPDGDGVSNIAEFALNGNPASGASTGKVVGKVASVGGSPTLVLTLPVRSGATFSGSTEQVSALIDGVIYHIQGSDQLSVWDLAVSEVLGTDKTAIESGLPALDGGWTYRTFQSPGGVGGDPADFLRAVIESP